MPEEMRKLQSRNLEKTHRPIESFYLIFETFDLVKCFTFYSALDSYWRDQTLNVQQIMIRVAHRDEWWPRHNRGDLFIKMHSPNTFPQFSFYRNWFTRLKYNKYYTISFRLDSVKFNFVGQDQTIKAVEGGKLMLCGH